MLHTRAVSWLLFAVILPCATCSPNDMTDGAGALDRADVIFLVLAEPPNAHMDALFDGTVIADDAGCIRLQNVEQSTVVWPFGATLDDSGPELRVRAASGRVLGRIGGRFRFGGGHVPALLDGIGLSQAERNRALERCPGDFWIVGATD